MAGKKMLKYEKKEQKIINRIARDSATLKKMQSSEIKGIKKHIKKHHK